MSWQQDEIQKRRAIEKELAERERKRAVRASHIMELWTQFLNSNKNLPRELQLTVSREYSQDDNKYSESMRAPSYCPIKKTGMISLDTKRGLIFFMEPHYGGGGPPPIFEHAIVYDEIDSCYFTCQSADVLRHDNREPLYYGKVTIGDQAVDIIIRNLCTGEPRLTEGLWRPQPVGDPPQPKRRKLFGIF